MVTVGRYALCLDAPGGTVLKPSLRQRKTEPPEELRKALAADDSRPDLERPDRIGEAEEKTDHLEPVLTMLGAIAEGRIPDVEEIAQVADEAFAGLQQLAKDGQWAEAIRLGRQLSRLLVLAGRWYSLVQTLRIVLRGAIATGDDKNKAWALHELGTLHRCVGDKRGARQRLRQAHEIRKAIGDKSGLAATRHNARLSGRHLVPASRPGAATALFVGTSTVVVAAVVALQPGGGPHSPPAPLTVAKRTHRHVTRRRTTSRSVTTASTQSTTEATSTTGTTASQTGSPMADLSQHELPFSGTAPGHTSAPQRVTVTNTGGGALSISGVRISSGDAGAFAIASDSCEGAKLQPRAQCSVSVTFTPSGIQEELSALYLSDNGLGSPQFVNLDGTPASAAQANVEPNPLTFVTDQGITQQPQPVTVTNVGTAPLQVERATLTGSGAHDFAVSGDSCSSRSVSPQSDCTIDVEYTGPVNGSAQASLELPFANAGSSPVTLLANQ